MFFRDWSKKYWTWLIIFCAALSVTAAENNQLAGVFPETVKVIAIVAPGLPASRSNAVDKAVKLLASAGKKVKIMPNARRGEPCRNYKDNVAWQLRVADLEQAWMDPEVDLILCVRGGSGTAQIVKHLNWAKLRTRPDMPVMGFSDITALHLAMLKEKAGHPLCGPSLTKLLQVDQASLESIRLGLSGLPRSAVELDVLKKGNAEGVILAGHLSLFERMNKSSYRPDTANKVIFIECPNLNEKQAAASLETLRRSGFFEHCSAVVFGRLSKCKKGERQVKADFAATVACPVFDGFPYSHTQRNHLLDLRKKVAISENGILNFL